MLLLSLSFLESCCILDFLFLISLCCRLLLLSLENPSYSWFSQFYSDFDLTLLFRSCFPPFSWSLPPLSFPDFILFDNNCRSLPPNISSYSLYSTALFSPFVLISSHTSSLVVSVMHSSHWSVFCLCFPCHSTTDEPFFSISRDPGFGFPLLEGITVTLKCDIGTYLVLIYCNQEIGIFFFSSCWVVSSPLIVWKQKEKLNKTNSSHRLLLYFCTQ